MCFFDLNGIFVKLRMFKSGVNLKIAGHGSVQKK